jgi:hypothetical protein
MIVKRVDQNFPKSMIINSEKKDCFEKRETDHNEYRLKWPEGALNSDMVEEVDRIRPIYV